MPTPALSPLAAVYTKAQRHLGRKCEVMKGLIKQVGPCTWAPETGDPFTMLVRCVISQQISTKAAKSIFAKLAAAVGGLPIDRATIAAMTDEQFRACGVSAPKQRTLRGLAEHFSANPEILHEIELREEEILRPQLTAIKGIGPWSVDMFLMFGMGRMDVLPVGDLGLRMGVKEAYGLAELPTPVDLIALAEPWRPYRSIATWYFWRSRGFVPQSGDDK